MSSKNKKFEPTPDELAYIIEKLTSGEKSATELGAEFGFGPSAVYSLMKRNGVKLYSTKEKKELNIPNYNKKYDYDHEFIKFLNDKGYCLQHISQITSISIPSLSNYYTINGLKRNRVTDDLTPFQFNMVINRYNSGMSIEESCSGFDINYKTATYWLKKFGVKIRNAGYYAKKKVPAYSELGDKVVEVYVSGKSMLDTSKITGVYESRVDEIITERGVKRTKEESCVMAHGVEYNDKAFESFDEEHAAYFYGFILADGCLSKDLKKISLTIKDTDVDIVNKFSEYVCTGREPIFSEVFDNRTGKTYKRCNFNFTYKPIVDRLVNQNLEPNKSGKEKLPKFDWLHNKHFWRGLIDGDGWVYPYMSSLGIVGSEEVVNGFLEFAEENIGLITKRTPSKIKGKTVDYCRVVLTGQDARNMTDYLYRDATVYLDRKHKAHLEFKELYGISSNTRGHSKGSL